MRAFLVLTAIVAPGLATTRVGWLGEWELAHGPLVATPCGHRPAVCVREAPHGAEIRFPTQEEIVQNSGADMMVVMQNRTVMHVRVPKLCHDFMAAWQEHIHEKETMTASVPDGWIKSAGVYQMDPSRQIHSFSGEWTVPPAPLNPHKPETLYYFIGLEDRTQGKNTVIHQPVLTWGDETEGGQYSNQWHLWSWTCCPKNLTWHSTDIAGFQPGDKIFGSIEKIAGETWRIDGAFQDSKGTFHNTTLTSQVGSFDFNYADVTLEVYNVTSCDQMAEGAAVFSKLDLATSDGSAWVPPTWYVTGMPNNCKTEMHISDSHSMSISSGGGLDPVQQLVV